MEYKLEFRIKVHECNVLWEGSKSLEIAHCEHIHLHEVECTHHICLVMLTSLTSVTGL